MDGNGRWAEARGLARAEGHLAGTRAVVRTVENAFRAGVEYVTLYAFSSENWRRPPEEIRTVMDAYAEVRRGSQPRERSAGCTFRNPENVPAGKLIDGLGLKGSRVGGAEVSDVHANFIIARDGATASDVVALVRRIHGIVKAERGIDLDPEIVLLGSKIGRAHV